MKLSRSVPTAAALLAISSIALAGDTTMSSKAPIEVVEVIDEGASAVSGVLSLDVNTHFISYGADVWGAGDEWTDALFNPLLELSFALDDQLTLVLGTWWDVNDNATSSIGDKIQEIDVWTGLKYQTGKLTTSLLYQAWMYGGSTEQIVDLIFALDVPLSPSLTIHGRVDPGASGGDNGVVPVLGIAVPLVETDSFNLSLPVKVAAATDGFHGGGGGFAYTSAGLSASVPLEFIDSKLGEWSLNTGLTYYYTNNDVIPNNPDDSFLTGMIGVGVAF